MIRKHYTQEESEFLREYVPGHSYKEIVKEFSKRFGDIRESQIRGYIKNHNLNTGRTGRFEKGHIPATKGKKMTPEQYAKSAPTMFKKGAPALNTRPIGSERVSVDGYVLIKVSDSDDYRERWRFKSHVIWEKHNGLMPKGMIITHLDGNRLNCDISNLIMISRAEALYMTRCGMNNLTGESKKAAVLLARLSINTEKKKRGLKNEV